VPAAIMFMEALLSLEAEAKSLLSGTNRSYELVLKEELLKILEEVESVYGPRDRSYEILAPRITECYYAHPAVYPPRNVRIYLTKEARAARYLASYELAHEAVHVLTPASLHNGDTLLEEGLATHFCFKYMKRAYGVDYQTTGHRIYDDALRAVSKLLAKNEFVIKELRTHQPVITKIDEDLLVDVAGTDRELAKFLCKDFWSCWDPPIPMKARATKNAQLFAMGLKSIWEQWTTEPKA